MMTLDEALKTGDACTRCHRGIYRASCNTVIAPAQCQECRQVDKPDELDHSSLIRCPKCKESWKVWDMGDYDLLVDGEHEVECCECDHKFKITTEVSHNFTSPAIEDQDAGRAG